MRAADSGSTRATIRCSVVSTAGDTHGASCPAGSSRAMPAEYAVLFMVVFGINLLPAFAPWSASDVGGFGHCKYKSQPSGRPLRAMLGVYKQQRRSGSGPLGVHLAPLDSKDAHC